MFNDQPQMTITEKINGETVYLNHSQLKTCSFGPLEMAWTTRDCEKAHLMLEHVIKTRGRDDFIIQELCE